MLYTVKTEDGVAQSYFEYLRIPYTHSGVIASYAMNKIISKNYFQNKILTPKFFSLHSDDNKSSSFSRLLKTKKN